MPFLENVTRGRGVPPERLAAVAEHYQHFGGVSPINEQNRALIAALRADLAAHGIELPVYWGNRNWRPYVERHRPRDGRRTAFARAGLRDVGLLRRTPPAGSTRTTSRPPRSPLWARRRRSCTSCATTSTIPGFIEPQLDAVRERSTASIAGSARDDAAGVHRPLDPGGDGRGCRTRAAGCTSRSCEAAAAADRGGRAPTLGVGPGVLRAAAGRRRCRGSSPTSTRHLRALAADGVTDVVVVPVGFVSDHIEVRWDLDVEAAATAARAGPRASPHAAARRPIRGSSRWCASWCRSGSTAARREARALAARSVARHLPGRLLPGVR